LALDVVNLIRRATAVSTAVAIALEDALALALLLGGRALAAPERLARVIALRTVPLAVRPG
jgi:hypothetical protein